MDDMKKEPTRRDFIRSAATGVALVGISPAMARRAYSQSPTINLGFILSDHHAPLMALAANWEFFQGKYNICFKPVMEGKLYDFMYEGSKAARVRIIPTAKGPDLDKLVAQGSVDVGISGTQSIMMAIDQGVPTRLVSPLQTAGNVFVLHKDLGIKNWEEFTRSVKGSGKRFKIGAPGPDTIAMIVFRSALDNVGVTYTDDAGDKKADVLFMNMKGHGNLVAALTNGISEGIIGAQPFPAVTVKNGSGVFIMNLQDSPPGGKWQGHACCSVEATESFVARDRDLTVKIMELIALGVEAVNGDREMAAKTCSAWLGIEEDVERSALTAHDYTITPSERWIESVYTFAETMDEMKRFNGKLSGKRHKDIDALVFDFRYVEEAKINLKRKKLIT